MAIALAQATDNATLEDTRRITEDDPDYQQLHSVTVARLQRSVRQYAREVQRGDAGADTRFINRHIALMRQAYEAAHHAGQADYWPAVSTRSVQHRYIAPDADTTNKRLAYYALGSVLKMAHEIKSYVTNPPTTRLSEPITSLTWKLYNENHDSKGRFTTGTGSLTKGHTPEARAAATARREQAQARARSADAQLSHETQRILAGNPNARNWANGGRAYGRIAEQYQDARYQAARDEMDSSLEDLRAAYHNEAGMHSAEETDATSQQVFGHALSEEEYRSLVGAPKNADVTVSTDGEQLLIHTEGKAGRNATFFTDREVYKQGDNIVIHNDYFMIDGTTGKGFGTKVFADEVEGARALGVSKIVTLAARQEGVFNGYYTWPRLGYDARLPASFRASIPNQLDTEASHG